MLIFSLNMFEGFSMMFCGDFDDFYPFLYIIPPCYISIFWLEYQGYCNFVILGLGVGYYRIGMFTLMLSIIFTKVCKSHSECNFLVLFYIIAIVAFPNLTPNLSFILSKFIDMFTFSIVIFVACTTIIIIVLFV